MNIESRIGPIGGTMRAASRLASNRGGGQDCPDDPTSIWSPRSPVSNASFPTKNPDDGFLRRGAGACALFASRMSSRGCARLSGADQCHSLAITRSMPAFASCLRFQEPPVGSPTAYEPNSIPQAVPTTKNSREITQLSGISTRFWSKSRSYRKQTIKPFLPGSRIAQCDAQSLRDFCANFAPAEPHRGRPPVARKATQS
jgi:hypothetical protein